jgi:hypothetical protein
MIRGEYVPTERPAPTKRAPVAKFLKNVEDGDLSREELLTAYFSLVYSKSGSYRAAGRQLGVDWRTVKENVDSELARRFVDANIE